MKGIVLAGGSGTRLFPLTKVISKALLPVYDKPMIYYPISVLMLAGIRDIMVISAADDLPNYKKLLGDGSELGINISYGVEEKPLGIAPAFLIGEEFIGKEDVCLILGDNIFHGHGFSKQLKNCVQKVSDKKEAIVFGYYVKDPERYGIVEFDREMNAVSIEEKPKNPKSSYAVVGLYFYPNKVVEVAKKIKPSARGEYEITTINEEFLKMNRLSVELLGRGHAWLDTGTHDSLLEAGQFIETIEKRQGLKISCLHEIALKNGWISPEQLLDYAAGIKNEYGVYLRKIALSEAGNLVGSGMAEFVI
jgi:glucose-1-phosphate thymidylyltransferase